MASLTPGRLFSGLPVRRRAYEHLRQAPSGQDTESTFCSGGACPCTIGTAPVARPGKSSAAARRSWGFLLRAVLFRWTCFLRPFSLSAPVSCPHLAASHVAFREPRVSGLLRGFPVQGRSCFSVPSLRGPGFHNPVRRRTFVRSAGWGAWGRCSGHPVRLVGLCLFGWGSVLLPPPPVSPAEWRQSRDLVGCISRQGILSSGS